MFPLMIRLPDLLTEFALPGAESAVRGGNGGESYDQARRDVLKAWPGYWNGSQEEGTRISAGAVPVRLL